MNQTESVRILDKLESSSVRVTLSSVDQRNIGYSNPPHQQATLIGKLVYVSDDTWCVDGQSGKVYFQTKDVTRFSAINSGTADIHVTW